MQPRFLVRLFLVPALVLWSSVVVLAGPPKFVTAVEGIAEFQLDNGMKILLFLDPSKPQVTVNMTVFVGSQHEGYGEAGMAHLLEHMLFKGTPDHSNIPKLLGDLGARFNGTTSYDRTNYYETMPANAENLEVAIRLEADRLVNSFVKKEDLDSEMTVVRNEFERGENSPSRVLFQRMMAVAFEWHNYGKTTIGNRADIERVPIENLQRFYRKHYQPDNAMVIVAGKFNPERALQLLQKYFGAIPKPDQARDHTYTEEPAQDGERRVVLKRVGDVALASALYHIPSGAHPDFVPLDVLAHILTNAPSGRLYEALVKPQTAAQISGGVFSLHDPGIMQFSAVVTPGGDPNKVLSTMVDEVERIAESGVTEEEVERSKRYWLKNWELTLAKSSQVAISLSEWAASGDWRLMFLYRDRLEKVTVTSVQEAAKKYLQGNNRTVGLFLPTEQAQRIAIPATPDVQKMIGDYKGREAISQGEEFDVSPTNVEARTTRSTLGSGIKLALLPKKTRGQTVEVRVTLRFGNEKNLRGKEVACEILPGLMVRGTKNFTRQQLKDELDKNRARLSASGGVGSASFSIQTRRDSLPEVLNLLQQVLREPSLPVGELDLIRNAQLTALESRLSDPTSLAQMAIQRKTNPYDVDDVRYVPTVKESMQRWESVTIDDVGEIYREFLGTTHGEIAVVGDFDPESVTAQLEKIVAGWNTKADYQRIAAKGDVELTDERQEILTPDKENAVFFAASVFPLSDNEPDYVPLMIGNDILGAGGMSSRLAERVRQKEGLSYSVGSMLHAGSIDKRAVFMIYAITNPKNIEKVEHAISDEIAKILKAGITEEELAAAKKSYLEGQIVSRSSDSRLAGLLRGTSYLGRTMEFYEGLEKQVSELTVDQVNSALKKHIKPNRITLAVAGDFEKEKE